MWLRATNRGKLAVERVLLMAKLPEMNALRI